MYHIVTNGIYNFCEKMTIVLSQNYIPYFSKSLVKCSRDSLLNEFKIDYCFRLERLLKFLKTLLKPGQYGSG